MRDVVQDFGRVDALVLDEHVEVDGLVGEAGRVLSVVLGGERHAVGVLVRALVGRVRCWRLVEAATLMGWVAVERMVCVPTVPRGGWGFIAGEVAHDCSLGLEVALLCRCGLRNSLNGSSFTIGFITWM